MDGMAFLTSQDSKTTKYLLGFLNSRAIFYYFSQIGHLYSDKGFLLSNQYVERFPIPKITQSNQPTADKIITLVEEILKTKEQDPKADTSAQEREIDNLVYTLYSLTPEEIAIIKGK